MRVYKKSTLKSDKFYQNEAMKVLENRLKKVEIKPVEEKLTEEMNKKMKIPKESSIQEEMNKKMKL